MDSQPMECPAPVFCAEWHAPKPHVNTAFATDLLDMADTWKTRVGEMSLGFYLERGLASNKTMPEDYYERELAKRLRAPMRLTGRGRCWPLYSYPRLARYAFFTGTGLVELDFPASHGHLLPAAAVKSACNLLAYGNGLADWRKAHRMAGIPPALQALKDELAATPQSWKDAVRDRKHPELTLGSLVCQTGILEDVTIHGWNAARAYARRWLDLKEDEDREGPLPLMPHLDFAVCVEGELPCQYNYASKELEFFNANAGVWMHTGGQAYCRGELLKDALCKVLRTPRWGVDKDGKTRLLPGDDPLFHTAPVLSAVGGMLDKVTPDLSLPDLRQRQPADA
ncbi:unnamed protein product, partial [Effrenium voratum]